MLQLSIPNSAERPRNTIPSPIRYMLFWYRYPKRFSYISHFWCSFSRFLSTVTKSPPNADVSGTVFSLKNQISSHFSCAAFLRALQNDYQKCQQQSIVGSIEHYASNWTSIETKSKEILSSSYLYYFNKILFSNNTILLWDGELRRCPGLNTVRKLHSFRPSNVKNDNPSALHTFTARQKTDVR